MEIDAVVTIMETFHPPRDEYTESIEWYFFPLEDRTDQNITKWFEPFATVMQNHQRVLVHCMAGHSRSVALAASWMLKEEPTVTVEDMLERLSRLRPGACPNAGFKKQLEHVFPR